MIKMPARGAPVSPIAQYAQTNRPNPVRRGQENPERRPEGVARAPENRAEIRTQQAEAERRPREESPANNNQPRGRMIDIFA